MKKCSLTNKSCNFFKGIIEILTLMFVPTLLLGQNATTSVITGTIINSDCKSLLGVSFDARTGMNGTSDYVGYFDTSGALIPGIDTLFYDFPLHGLRYPGQAIMVGFEWKKSIGSKPRPYQNILNALGPSQSMDFGFDEFMAYCEDKGLLGKDIQIMVPIYDSAITYSPTSSNKNKGRVPYPAASAADWVEYANAPDTANWGGGIAWGARRAINGHPAPYNIKTWNIGNEPWGPSEMNFDSSQFFPIAKPIIDSMLARDPTIHITLPTTANANNDWNKMIRSYQRSHGNIYGVSPHFFSKAENLYLIETTLRTFIDSCNAVGLKVILGDFSHEINPGTSTLEQNRAMSWKGVRFTTDMLLLVSQLNKIERANHWVLGIPKNGWHPIRQNAVGDYTLMPVGAIYKIMSTYFLQNSISATSSSPTASDGLPYSLRASAFKNAAGDTIKLVAINRDTSMSLTYLITGLDSFHLFDSRILTSDSLTGEVIYSNSISKDSNGHFALPAMSILLLSYVSNAALPIQLISFTARGFKDQNMLYWTTASEINNDFFSVLKSTTGSNFQSIGTVLGAGNSSQLLNYNFTDDNPSPKVDYYKLQQTDYDGKSTFSNIISISNVFASVEPILVTPNPVSNYIQLSVNETYDVLQIQIINSIGEVVFQTKDQNKVDVSIYANGIYYVKVLLDGNYYVQKFLKLDSL